jgi:hypothetical protein
MKWKETIRESWTDGLQRTGPREAVFGNRAERAVTRLGPEVQKVPSYRRRRARQREDLLTPGRAEPAREHETITCEYFT